MFARLFNAPDVLRRIALFTAFDTDYSDPLRDFFNLTLLCRSSHNILSLDSAPLDEDIFSQTFDIIGPLSKLGQNFVQNNAKLEIRRRLFALDVFRRGDIENPRLTEAFWTAFIMYEDAGEAGKNVKHLLGAGLHGFLDRFLRQYLYRGSDSNNGWPVPNERNSLAIALFWLSTSPHSVHRESAEQRMEVAKLLKPFVFAAFRYPIFEIAENYFDVTRVTYQATSSSVHGPYPPPPFSPCNVAYFGRATREMHIPSISLFSTLSFFTREETSKPEMPPHLLVKKRTTEAAGHDGLTLDDVKHFAEHCVTRFAEFPGVDVGVTRKTPDPSSTSLMPAFNLARRAAYKLGMLTGSWQGSYILPFLGDYSDWLNTLDAPPELPTTGRFPLYMSLQEHFTCNSASVVRQVDAAANAWLPAGFKWTQRENGIEMFDEKNNLRTFYETFRRGVNPADVVDVIITGKTKKRHAAAWGDYHILGRVRLTDGLIMLAREALNGAGTSLLRGYVTSSQNFVGRFRSVSDGTQPAGWEAAFSLCRVLEADKNT